MQRVDAVPSVAAAVQSSGSGQAKLEKAARDFEAELLTSLLKSMREGVAGEEDSGDPGSDSYADMAVQGIAQAMAGRGGVGIAKLIVAHLQGK